MEKNLYLKQTQDITIFLSLTTKVKQHQWEWLIQKDLQSCTI